MTKFDELMDLITHNKNRDKKPFSDETTQNNDDIELEVSGSESTKGPLVAAASEELDPDIIDMLYTKPRHKPNDGGGAETWDLE